MTASKPVKFGLLFSTQLPEVPGSAAELWKEILDEAQHAEDVGFYSVHLPEHHMREDGYLPQPMVAAAAIAQRTRSVFVGPTVMVAPLRHPVHLAEEAAMVDVLSDGRLILGLGIGNFQPEFDLFGLPMEHQGALFDEVLGLLLRFWDGSPVHHEGRFFNFDGQIVRPLPVQQPRPPIWIGGMSKPGVRRAARFGLPLILDPLHPIEHLRTWVDLYREECAQLGNRPEVILIRYGWIGDADSLEHVWWPHLRQTMWTYLRDIPRLRTDVDPRIAACQQIDDLRLDWVKPDRFLIGTEEEVLATARRWAERLDCDHVIVKLQGSTGPWGSSLSDTVEAWGRAVARPLLASDPDTIEPDDRGITT